MTLPGPAAWPVDDPVTCPTGDLLRERAQSSHDATSVVDADTGDRWTYAAFDERASARLAGLRASADSGGFERVGCLLGTRPGFAVLYFAVARAGATLVPLNVRLDRETLAAQAERAALDLLVCGAGTADDAVAVTPEDVPVVSLDESAPSSVTTLPTDDSAPEDPPAPVESSADSERLLMFTSGTTGEPKGVRLTLDNLVSSAAASAQRLDVAPDDRWLVCLPMYHMGGLAPLVRSTLYGTTTVLQSAFDAGETSAVLEEYDVTCVSLVPTMLTRLLDAGWTPPERLRFVLLGGGPILSGLVDRCEDLGVPVCPTYGATETASQVATALPEEAFEHRGTVGRPLRGTSVDIVADDAGTPREPGDVGELVVDGPTVSPGYLDDDQTAAAFGPHGFETGDVGYRDEGGRLWVLGRADDQIVTGGENVQPAVVATEIRTLAGVDDVVVLGIPDEEWGESVAALVESSDPALSAEAVRDHCRESLADYEVPKAVRFTDTLPRTASGTVDRECARSLLAER